ncbi:MAG: hypothetical protein Q9220_002493 [cf. Caloplaca sp. 1 TL-2023]
MSTLSAISPQLPPSLRLAQAVGIITSAFLSGGVLAVSYGFVPSMAQAPNTLLVREWQTTYGRGAAASPALAIVSTISYLYLSYNLSFTLNQHKAEVYALAAAAVGSIVPFTLIFMKNINRKLKNKVEDSKDLDRSEEMNESKDRKGEHSNELLSRWATWNFIRGLLPLTGATLGVYASFWMTS